MNFFQKLFQANPSSAFNYYLEMAILIAVTLVVAIALNQLYKKRKKTDRAFKNLFHKTSGRLTSFAILFTVLLLIRSENIPYFSMRLWLYLTFLGFLAFILKTLHTYYKKYPLEKAKYQNKAQQSKKTPKKTYTTSKKRK